eukprot:GFYU01006747.1.p1 GENE.GFYU01006747.1~~GFYU01006747.1.p1  ORF type:complete len:284 (-),score=78.34 GFYU01006747.1:309-1160(-)
MSKYTENIVTALVDKLGSARLNRTRIGDDVTLVDATLYDAYEAQRRLEGVFKDTYGKTAGLKVGCTTQVQQKYLGIPHPCYGRIYEKRVFPSHASVPFDQFLHVGVECEIAVELSSEIGPPTGGGKHSRESVMPAIKRAIAAIEIVDDRYVDFQKMNPPPAVWAADDFFQTAVVVGSAPASDTGGDQWKQIDLAEVEGRMWINDTEVGSGKGKDIINGHPLEALVWLANARTVEGTEGEPRPIPAGSIVMLGSVVQTKWVKANDTVRVDIGPLGTASVTFTAP